MRKKSKNKNNSKKIVIVLAISLVILGCLILYYGIISKQNTISVKDNNILMQNTIDGKEGYLLSFKYKLKGTYKIDFNVYEENKKIEEQEHHVYLNDSGICYFIYREITSGKYKFDVYTVRKENGINGSFIISFDEKYSKKHKLEGIYTNVDADKLKRLVLTDKEEKLFEVYPFEEQAKDGRGNNPSTKIVANIKKVKKATNYTVEGIE